MCVSITNSQLTHVHFSLLVSLASQRLSELGIQFSKNLGEENTKFTFTAEQLTGLPEDFINGYDVV